MRHIVLTGLPGSGKTSLGKLAAARLGVPFVDVDEKIEKRFMMPIRQIFEEYGKKGENGEEGENGEKIFRDAESAAMREALTSKALSVIATGGGAVLRPENVSVMRDRGLVIFLDRPAERIAEDVPIDGSRPLFTGVDKLYEMERARRALYIDAADRTLPNGGGIEDALDGLLEIIGNSTADAEYAVIGDPIAHSLSPAIHGAVFEALGISGSYSAVRVSRGGLAGFFETARESGMRGFNVTSPHKRDIMPFLDHIDEEAALCGAVNTVVSRGGKSHGHNTDMGGLLFSLQESGTGYAERRVVILGAGGAARGAALKASREKAAEIVILARDTRKAEEIASDFSAIATRPIHARTMTEQAMKDAARGADLLINATTLGMSGSGENFRSLEFLSALTRSAFICDLVYDPPETALLKRASELGLKCRNGLGMLICQAISADELFLGRKLDRSALHYMIKERLSDARKIDSNTYNKERSG
jgi:shikimate dehydrogenase